MSKSGFGARGCLFGCLAPIVVLGVAVLFALPSLRDKWAAFEKENPWVKALPGVASTVKDVAGSMGGSADSSAGDSAGTKRTAKALEGVDDKKAMPSDLPLWPRPKAETFSAGKNAAAAYQRVTQRPDSVLGFYRRTMPTRGWHFDQERKGAGGTLLLYRKADRIARVEVVPDSIGTDIWIRSRTTSSAQP